jgi:hypothetical protein
MRTLLGRRRRRAQEAADVELVFWTSARNTADLADAVRSYGPFSDEVGAVLTRNAQRWGDLGSRG